TFGLLNNTLHLLKPKKAVGSLALTSTMDNKELKYFLSLRYQTSVALKIYGTEPIPGRMLSPSYIGVIMLLELKKSLYEWYKILYESKYKNIERFMDLVINQYTKLQIGDEIFGSMILGHKNNSIILAKWQAKGDKTSDIYPGEVQYYFEHTLRLPKGPKPHLLAYIR
ncbi:20513_t:CDS:1, partial [Racocetra persica]